MEDDDEWCKSKGGAVGGIKKRRQISYGGKHFEGGGSWYEKKKVEKGMIMSLKNSPIWEAVIERKKKKLVQPTNIS